MTNPYLIYVLIDSMQNLTLFENKPKQETVSIIEIPDVLQSEVQQTQAQNPCDFCIDNPDICPEPKEAVFVYEDVCLGIPIKMNLCAEHYYERKEIDAEEKSGGNYN